MFNIYVVGVASPLQQFWWKASKLLLSVLLCNYLTYVYIIVDKFILLIKTSFVEKYEGSLFF